MVTYTPLKVVDLTCKELWSWKQSLKPVLTPPEEVICFEPDLNWKPCSQMPSLIHCELLDVGDISEPFLGLNEKDIQWVGEKDWIYRCQFELSSIELSGYQNVNLVFEGLDTFGTVYLNGTEILSCNNMFISHRIDVTNLLAETNTLLIVFTSAFIKGRIIEEKRGGAGRNAAWNGDTSRLFVRKAAYHYGWDWGPTLLTSGIWKPVRVEFFSSKIDDLDVKALVNEDLECSLAVAISTTGSQLTPATARVSFLRTTGSLLRCATIELKTCSETLIWKFEPKEVDLWWSAGIGKQHLYDVKVELMDISGFNVIETRTIRVGFRRLKVIQEPLVDEAGTTFRFEINGAAIFCGGSNWIPIDSFLTNATPERYRKWIKLLVAGNQNMIRSWGGGIYENDCFFDICDELGVLVWQDFQFACGQYPAYHEYVESVRLEAEQNVKRIRHHPSIAIYAGNNEDYQVAESLNLEYDPEDKDGDWLSTNFPARQIYERELPEIVNRLTNTYYHPGSPWGGKDSRDPEVGDIHQWNVWHGTQEPYQNWDQLGGRFVSEFGMQALPDSRTIDYFLDGDDCERYPQSKIIGSHNKATGYERRIELYLVENIRHTFEMAEYIYSTQFIQAEALSSAYRVWRRRFQGPEKYYVGGCLVWQLNDVWPCTSWSIVDYFLRPKPAYYAIKQALAPVTISSKRSIKRVYKPYHSALYSEEEFVEIWGGNSTLSEVSVKFIVEVFNLETGEVIYTESRSKILGANQSTELRRLKVPMIAKGSVVVSAKIIDSTTNEVLSRFSVYPEPYKFLTFPSEEDTALEVVVDITQGIIRVNTQRPVKGLIFSFDSDVTLDNNCLDLNTREERIIVVDGLEKVKLINWRHLGGHGAVKL